MPKKSSTSTDVKTEDSDDTESSMEHFRKRRRISSNIQNALCHEIYDRLKVIKKEDGTALVDALRLPNKRSNPGYYESVTSPMDPARIVGKIKAGEYRSVQEMADDITLVISNTRSFFGLSSQESADAAEFEIAFNQEARLVQQLHSFNSTASCSSTSSNVTEHSRKLSFPKTERRDDDESAQTDVDAASITASEDSRLAASETSATEVVNSRRVYNSEQSLKQFFASIVNFEAEDGHQISQTFSTLPSRVSYPQYYEIITEPIDLRLIAQRILSGTYQHLSELEKDFLQMARNAKHFNEPKSRFHQDAKILTRIVKIKRLEARKPSAGGAKIDIGKAQEIIEEFATLPDPPDLPVVELMTESGGTSPSAPPSEVSEKASKASRKSIPLSPTGVTPKRGRGRPRKIVLEKSVSSPESSHHSSPSRQLSISGQGNYSRETSILDESGDMEQAEDSQMTTEFSVLSTSPGFAPAATSFGSNDALNTSSLSASMDDQSMPSMLSTAAVGSLRWWGEHVLEAICTVTNSAGNLMALPFMRLPSKKLYPDYFKKIQQPMCLAKIRRRIKRNEFDSLAEVKHDVDLVFTNAQEYNLESSQIYKDAVYLQQVTQNKFVELSQISSKGENPVHLLKITTAKRRPGRPPSVTNRNSGYNDGAFEQQKEVSDEIPIVRSEIVSPNRRHFGRHAMTVDEARAKRLINLYNAVYNFIDENGHRPRDTFLLLPSRDMYPDYYQVIRDPIDLTIIKDRMDKNLYPAHQSMVADLRLMFANARRYNEEDSQVFRDAVILDKIVKKKLKSLGPHSSLGTDRPRTLGVKGKGGQSPVVKKDQDVNTAANLEGLVSATGVPQMPSASPSVPPLQRLMIEVFQVVREYREPCASGRQLSSPFLRLPSKTEMPTYYEFTKRPVELQTIAKNLLQGTYHDFDEFMSELFLMFDNACMFNEPDSQIYKDTLILHRAALTKRNMLLSSVLSSGANIPGLAHSNPPDIGPGIRRLLTSLHNAMLTACDSEGRGLVDSLIAGDGTELSVTSATAARLAALHRSVAAGAYRRLDRLQADWLEVLRRARVGENEFTSECATTTNRPTPQQRQDAAELARRWVRLRDTLCRRQPIQLPDGLDLCLSLPTNMNILSSALGYTEAALERDLNEEVIKHEPIVFGDDDGEEDLPPLENGAVELPVIEVCGQSYRVGDYVYFESIRPAIVQYHIGRITRILRTSSISTVDSPSSSSVDKRENNLDDPITRVSVMGHSAPNLNVRVAVYMRPSEAKPSRRRRLLAAEVFRTAVGETIPPNKLAGHCLVLPINQFIRCRPKNVEERDVFVCESQFSIIGQIFVKLRRWSAPTPYGIELEERPVPFVPTRLPPSEPLESALEQVNTQSYSCMIFPLPRPVQTVVDEVSKTEGTIGFEQYVHENASVIKQGDFLFVAPQAGSAEKRIVRVDKIGKNINDNSIFFTGQLMISLMDVEHLPTRLFYPREVFLTNKDRATFPLSAALGKCFVMRPADFCIARPTNFRETEIYICEAKYFEDEKEIRKIKKPFKKYNFTPETLEDEFFFFPQPILPRKEASPLLSSASPTPLSLEQLNRPASTALASVVAAANSAPPQRSSSPGFVDSPRQSLKLIESSHNQPAKHSPTLSMDAGQLAFIEAGLDRSGKKRKLRKPPSGYVIYAGEVRKKLLHDRPDAPFGEISREVGLLWRQMPAEERDVYERKAQLVKRRMEEEEHHVKARRQQEDELQNQRQKLIQQQQNEIVPSVLMPGVHQNMQSQQNPMIGALPDNLMPMMSANSSGIQLHPSTGQVQPNQHAPAMHFYQTPSGQVIQVMHTSSASGNNIRTSQAIGGPIGVQSNLAVSDHVSPLVTGTTLLPNTMPTANFQQMMGTHQPVIAASANQQVVYQFTGQQAAPCGTGMPNPNVNISGSVGPQQVILTHSLGQQGVLPGHTHQFTGAGPVIQGRTASVTMPQSQQQQQPCLQVLQQITSGSDGPTPMGHVQHNATAGNPTLMGMSSVNMQPSLVPLVDSLGGHHPPPPLFVSLPPRTSRVLHSEIYQNYIDRLRRNAPGLSDWRKQISATVDSIPGLTMQQQQQLATNFLDVPLAHSHQGSVIDALWNLRDNLLKDSLNIRVRCLGVDEL